jgi:hypothetical protein
MVAYGCSAGPVGCAAGEMPLVRHAVSIPARCRTRWTKPASWVTIRQFAGSASPTRGGDGASGNARYTTPAALPNDAVIVDEGGP